VHRTLAVSAVLTALLATTPVRAAEVTDMPPKLRGDVRIDYLGALEHGDLREDDEAFGRRHANQHDVRYTLEFAPIDGLSVWFQVDTTLTAAVAFTDPHEMQYDPVTDTGTYQGSDALPGSDESYRRRGGGLNGLWIGVGAGPFAEAWGPAHQMTWRVDVGFRTPNPNNTFWTSSGQHRGASPGGSAFLLRGAWSQEDEPVDAYLVGKVLYEGRVTVDVTDDDGTTIASDVAVKPAAEVDATAGVELIAGRDQASGERFAFDLFCGFGYRSFAEVPSGVLLPQVLERSRGMAVARSAHVRGTAGLGLIYHLNKYFGARLAGTGTYVTPHRLEAVYPVRTGYDTVIVGIQASLEGRLR
jgi:hypothetical protein